MPLDKSYEGYERVVYLYDGAKQGFEPRELVFVVLGLLLHLLRVPITRSLIMDFSFNDRKLRMA